MTTQAEIIGAALAAVQSGQETWLITIVEITGSLPRPLGSLMTHSRSGTVGSVSGGCVEQCLIERLEIGEFPAGTARLTQYGVDASDNERYGLPCGGRLTLLVEALTEQNISELTTLRDALAARALMQRSVALEPYTVTLASVAERPQRWVTLTPTQCHHYLGPEQRLILVGAGHLAETLSRLALQMDYDVWVIDPRPEVISAWSGPDLTMICGEVSDHIANFADAYTALITLTHDRDIDDHALLAVRDYPFAFIGALGSRRTSANRRARLQALGLSESDIARIQAPVGLDIGSKTPMEIAISILAELTQLHRGSMTKIDAPSDATVQS